MTQKGPYIAPADEGPQIPSASTNDTLANNLANSGLGACTEDDAVVAMEGEIRSQWEDGGWGCRAAHLRGERKIRGDVIWRPQHEDPRHPGHPARQFFQI